MADKSQTQTPRSDWRRASVLAALVVLVLSCRRRFARLRLERRRHRRNVRRRARQPDDAAQLPLPHAEGRRPARPPVGRHLCRTLYRLGRLPIASAATSDYAIVKLPCENPPARRHATRPSARADTKAKQQTYDRIVNALSMRDFRPTRGGADRARPFLRRLRQVLGGGRATISRTWWSTCSPLTARSRRNTSS